jgi:hypothetical protein
MIVVMLKREKYIFCLVMDSFTFLSGGIGINTNKGNWELQGLGICLLPLKNGAVTLVCVWKLSFNGDFVRSTQSYTLDRWACIRLVIRYMFPNMLLVL